MLEKKIDVHADMKKKEVELMYLISREKDYQHSPVQKELFELLKRKRQLEVEFGKWELKSIDETIHNFTNYPK
jgi:hypothetical protein